MIVVVIVGILAAIAFPAYQNQVRKTKRSEAKSALTELANREEKFYAQCLTYTNNVTGAFPTNTAACGAGGLGATSPTATGLYTLDVPASGSTFTVRATAVGTTTQAADTGCTTLTLTNTGSKGATANCW